MKENSQHEGTTGMISLWPAQVSDLQRFLLVRLIKKASETDKVEGMKRNRAICFLFSHQYVQKQTDLWLVFFFAAT